MKTSFYLLFIGIILTSCNTSMDNKSIDNDSLSVDSNASNLKSDSIVYVEDIFNITSDSELEMAFGKENITYDTIWGAEGMFYMGTKIFAKTPKEIIISWDDSLTHKKITSCTVNCGYDYDKSEYLINTYWKSKTGIKIGTTLNELVDLNGKDFNFYGLGWDYGGELISWNKGKLENAKITVTLGTRTFDNMPEAYNKLIGDHEFSSSDPNAKKLNPVVLVFSALNF